MFTTLPESAAPNRRSPGQIGLSIALHAIVIAAAIRASAGSPELSATGQVDTFVLEPVGRPPVGDCEAITPAAPPATSPESAGPIEARPPSLTIPHFGNVDVPGVTPSGVGGGEPVPLPHVPSGAAISVATLAVDSASGIEPPALIQPVPKLVPPGMESVAATVDVEFVVGVDGRIAAGSARVVASSSDAFHTAALRMVEAGEYRPATRHGAPVWAGARQRVVWGASP